jgi:hypothetical protein
VSTNKKEKENSTSKDKRRVEKPVNVQIKEDVIMKDASNTYYSYLSSDNVSRSDNSHIPQISCLF